MDDQPMSTPSNNVVASLFVYSQAKEALAQVKADPHVLQFYCLGKHTMWRYKTLYDKEPDTINWLNRIPEGDVLWDIGANVGLYTVYAGVTRKAKVLAFEPLASNYYVLNMNIELNKLGDRVHAYCMAFADETACGVLNASSSAPGAAGCSFNEAIDDRGNTFVPSFTQGMLGFTVDEFIEKYQPDFPNHLKIDVDGLESRIVNGAPKTLRDPRLKTISIELDANRPEYVEDVLGKIQAAGFVFVGKNRSTVIAPNSSINNYTFVRAEESAKTGD